MAAFEARQVGRPRVCSCPAPSVPSSLPCRWGDRAGPGLSGLGSSVLTVTSAEHGQCAHCRCCGHSKWPRAARLGDEAAQSDTRHRGRFGFPGAAGTAGPGSEGRHAACSPPRLPPPTPAPPPSCWPFLSRAWAPPERAKQGGAFARLGLWPCGCSEHLGTAPRALRTVCPAPVGKWPPWASSPPELGPPEPGSCAPPCVQSLPARTSLASRTESGRCVAGAGSVSRGPNAGRRPAWVPSPPRPPLPAGHVRKP